MNIENWKTTVSAIATAVFGFIVFSPELFTPEAVSLAKYAAAGGLLAFGITAGDAKKGGQ